MNIKIVLLLSIIVFCLIFGSVRREKLEDKEDKEVKQGIHLIIQYYNDKNPERAEENNECLRNNLNNSTIATIHNIIEKDTIMPKEFNDHPKLLNVPIDYEKTGSIKGRLTYKYAFDYSRDNIPNDEVVAICNLDIYLDDSEAWKNVKTDFFKVNNDKKCLSLTRYDKNNKNITSSPYSSDTWVYLNPIKVKDFCNFGVGNGPRCDSVINKVFYDSGYKLFNWPQKYRTNHVDFVRGDPGAQILNDKTDKLPSKLYNTYGVLHTSWEQDWESILHNKTIQKFTVGD